LLDGKILTDFGIESEFNTHLTQNIDFSFQYILFKSE